MTDIAISPCSLPGILLAPSSAICFITSGSRDCPTCAPTGSGGYAIGGTALAWVRLHVCSMWPVVQQRGRANKSWIGNTCETNPRYMSRSSINAWSNGEVWVNCGEVVKLPLRSQMAFAALLLNSRGIKTVSIRKLKKSNNFIRKESTDKMVVILQCIPKASSQKA